jgi:hypothetical protein
MGKMIALAMACLLSTPVFAEQSIPKGWDIDCSKVETAEGRELCLIIGRDMTARQEKPEALEPTDGPELFVNLKQYVGKTVRLVHADVTAAGNGGALVMAQGAQFRISWEGADPSTEKTLIMFCGSLAPGVGACKDTSLLVVPTGEQIEGLPGLGPYPILINVVFW